MLIELNEVKEHLKLDIDDNSENDLLEIYVNASIGWCEKYLNKKIIEKQATAKENELNINDTIKNAVFIMTTDLYENRQTADNIKNTTAERLLQFFRNY